MFDAKVRTPGKAFLKRFPTPSSEQFKKANHWKECLPDLRRAYSEVCAYSACWVHLDGTVDHFWPTSVRYDLAYEWSNFRLAFSKLNYYKGRRTDVLDPFHIQPNWFVLNFANLFVEASVGLAENVREAVETTIGALRLNSDDTLVSLRFTVVKDYANGEVSFEYLTRRYPFIATELERQGLRETVKDLLKK